MTTLPEICKIWRDFKIVRVIMIVFRPRGLIILWVSLIVKSTLGVRSGVLRFVSEEVLQTPLAPRLGYIIALTEALASCGRLRFQSTHLIEEHTVKHAGILHNIISGMFCHSGVFGSPDLQKIPPAYNNAARSSPFRAWARSGSGRPRHCLRR